MKMTKLIAIVLAVSSMLTVSALAVSAVSTKDITVKVNDTVIRCPDQAVSVGALVEITDVRQWNNNDAIPWRGFPQIGNQRIKDHLVCA